MPFVDIVGARFNVDAPLSTDLFGDIIGNLNFLNGITASAQTAVGSPLLINGSFEIDAVDTIQPTGWAFAAGGATSTGGVTVSDQSHGAKSYKVTQPANQPGGTLFTCDDHDSDKPNFFISGNGSYLLRFELKCSTADIHCKVEAQWYDEDKSFLSVPGLVLDLPSSKLSTSWKIYEAEVVPPPGLPSAKFGSFIFTLGASDVLPGGQREIYLDNVLLVTRPPLRNRKIFTILGAQTWKVPRGVLGGRIHLIGGGGGGYSPNGEASMGGGGGAGGYVSGLIPLYPDTDLSLYVGRGGNPNVAFYTPAGSSGEATTCNTLLGVWSAGGGTMATSVSGAAGGSVSASGADILVAGQAGKAGCSSTSSRNESFVTIGLGGSTEFSPLYGRGGKGGMWAPNATAVEALTAFAGKQGMVLIEY